MNKIVPIFFLHSWLSGFLEVCQETARQEGRKNNPWRGPPGFFISTLLAGCFLANCQETTQPGG